MTKNLYYVYLAGAINGLTKHEANAWRDQATKQLMANGVGVLNPLKDEAFMVNMEENDVYDDQHTNMYVTPEWIFKKDMDAINYADFILINALDIGDKACIGTLCELGIAIAKNKKVHIYNMNFNYHSHPFLSGENIQLHNTLNGAIDAILREI